MESYQSCESSNTQQQQQLHHCQCHRPFSWRKTCHKSKKQLGLKTRASKSEFINSTINRQKKKKLVVNKGYFFEIMQRTLKKLNENISLGIIFKVASILVGGAGALLLNEQ